MRVLRKEQAEGSIKGRGSVNVRRSNNDKVQPRWCRIHGLIDGGAVSWASDQLRDPGSPSVTMEAERDPRVPWTGLFGSLIL